MTVEYCLISSGTLSRNRLWGEGARVRTAHATTTLVKGEGRLILVDPSLPAAVLAARFNERTGKHPKDVTDVFCTTLRPDHRRGIDAFGDAAWWTHEPELEAYRDRLKEMSDSASRLDADDKATLDADLDLLRRFRPAGEKFTDQIHLYPLPGPSPGSAGLLLTPATTTILIAGDAALTAEHVLRGQVWEGCFDTEAAKESLRDMLQVADVLIPGHDNVFFPQRVWL